MDDNAGSRKDGEVPGDSRWEEVAVDSRKRVATVDRSKEVEGSLEGLAWLIDNSS